MEESISRIEHGVAVNGNLLGEFAEKEGALELLAMVTDSVVAAQVPEVHGELVERDVTDWEPCELESEPASVVKSDPCKGVVLSDGAVMVRVYRALLTLEPGKTAGMNESTSIESACGAMEYWEKAGGVTGQSRLVSAWRRSADS